MGFFSWKTADTDRSISNCYSSRGTFPVVMTAPDGTQYFEDNYEGYGIFGGKDYYQLLAEINSPELCSGNADEDRIIGINLYWNNKDRPIEEKRWIRYPLLTESPDVHWHNVESKNCPDQGYFYSNSEEDDFDEEEF